MTHSTKGPEGRGDRKKWTAREKLRVVMETGRLSDTELGAYLRREGVHGAQVEQWRAAAEAALGRPARASGAQREEAKRVQALERELRRKDAALAEAAALLVLKKKAQAIWGDADDSMDRRSAP